MWIPSSKSALPGQLDIPEVGQLNVTGLAQDKLQDALRSKLAASGHADSQIYLAPMDAQPITLFVTGKVPKPGPLQQVPRPIPC